VLSDEGFAALGNYGITPSCEALLIDVDEHWGPCTTRGHGSHARLRVGALLLSVNTVMKPAEAFDKVLD
jgi:hypothetical protein